MVREQLEYVVDGKGRKKKVILPIAVYEELLEALEELESLRAFDEAQAHKGEVIPLAKALAEIERGR